MIYDIRDSRRALSSTSRVGLAAQAAMYDQCGPWKAEALEDDRDVKGYVDPSRIKRAKLLRYNAEDTVRTARVYSGHLRDIKAEQKGERQRIQRLIEHQYKLAQVAARMSYRGFPVDEKRRRQLAVELTEAAAIQARKLASMTRKYGQLRVNLGRANDDGDEESGGGVNQRDLAALIYKECEQPGIKTFGLAVPFGPHSRTDSGKPSVKKQALLWMMGMDNVPPELKAIIKQVWLVNAPLKVRNSFIDSDLVISRIGPDGRMHASINSCGTETGRWSCSQPNLFNLSEDKDAEVSIRGDLPSARDIYVAGRGRVIVHKDMKAFEMFVLGEYTGDAELLRLLGHEDVHSARARAYFGISEEEQAAFTPKAWKQLRRIAKEIGLSCNYHAGVDVPWLKVVEAVDNPRFEEVQAIYDKFPIVHPGIAAHWKSSLQFAEAFGYNETAIMQRRRYYSPGEHLKDTDTSNYAIQGTAADIANLGIIEIDRRLAIEYPDAWLCMHVYDSFDVICKEKDAEAVSQLMDEALSVPYRIGPRPPHVYATDTKIDYRWSKV